MWTCVNNKSDGGSSPGVFLPSPGGPVFEVHGNGSLATVEPPQTAPPVDWGSGIIPGSFFGYILFIIHVLDHTKTGTSAQGGVAAAVFISFLLALYAALWKCMGTPPRKKEKKKGKIREQREQLC